MLREIVTAGAITVLVAGCTLSPETKLVCNDAVAYAEDNMSQCVLSGVGCEEIYAKLDDCTDRITQDQQDGLVELINKIILGIGVLDANAVAAEGTPHDRANKMKSYVNSL